MCLRLGDARRRLPEQRHLGPDQAAVGQIEWQQHDARVVARCFEVMIEEHVPELTRLVVVEIHEQERGVRQRIDDAQLVVEFDAIEGEQATIETHDIAEMQIAVTVAHVTLRVARGEVTGVPCDGSGEAHPECRRQQAGERRREGGEDLRAGQRRLAVAASRRRHGQRRMQGRQFAGESRDFVHAHRAGRDQAVERGGQVETAHTHRVLGLRAGVLVTQLFDAFIEARREAPVELELTDAEVPPPCRGREIDEAEIDRLLELPGMAAGQEHNGNVGLEADHFQAARRQLRREALEQSLQRCHVARHVLCSPAPRHPRRFCASGEASLSTRYGA